MKSSNNKFYLYSIGETGNLGTFLLSKNKHEELSKYFPKDYLTSICNHFNKKKNINYKLLDNEYISKYVIATKGGVLAALWDLCEEMKLGLEYSIKLFPISQYTIEVCNYFDLNPYRLLCEDVILVASNKPIECYKYLINNFDNVSFVGEFNDSNKRIRTDLENISYLTKDHKDELLKIFPKNFLKSYKF